MNVELTFNTWRGEYHYDLTFGLHPRRWRWWKVSNTPDHKWAFIGPFSISYGKWWVRNLP